MTATIEQTRVAAIYNPQTQTKAQLIEGFVVRQNTFKSLFTAIKTAKMDVPEQHYLVLGRRGMGKTTLLLRLAYEVENDPELNAWLIPLVFNEEEYGIRRLFNFWERIMQLLEQQHPEFRFDETERRRLSNQHSKDDDAYERALFDWLSGELERTGKKAILFIDNFGDMARKLTDAEAHRLRKILQTSADMRIFAASAVVMEAFYRYDHPFYEFFKVVELKGLDLKETRDLLLTLAQHYKKEAVERILEQHPGRVEALRRITGGVVRTMVLLFEIFADDDDGSAFKDLEIVLDRSTPLYKHRMDDLSDQQQAIVEAIALNWDALNVKEIAERTRLESKIISAQLQYLVQNGIIEKRATKTKNHLYIVAERFFNIWFLMRLGRRNDEKRVLWLVRFFEDWCDNDQMKSRAELHRFALRRGGFDPEAALSYTMALAHTQKLSPADRHELLRDTRSYLMEQSPELAKDLMPSDLDMAYEALELWFSVQKQAAIEKMTPLCNRLLTKKEVESIDKGIKAEGLDTYWEKDMPTIAQWIGNQFYGLEIPDFEKAEQCWSWAADVGHTDSMTSLGLLFHRKKQDFDTAIKWYKKAANSGNTIAMNKLGQIFEDEKKDFDTAIKWYEKAANAGDPDAMFNLGWIFNEIKKSPDTAIEWYQKAVDSGNTNAMNNLGVLYQDERKDFDTAIKWYHKSADIGDKNAMYNLGWIFDEVKKDIDTAIEWYQKSAKAGSPESMFSLAWIFNEVKKDTNTAIEWYQKAAEAGDSDAMYNLGWIFDEEKKDSGTAIEWYQKAAKAGDTDAMNALAYHFFTEKKEKEKALQLVTEALQKEAGDDTLNHTAACVLAWKNRLEESKRIALGFLKKETFLEDAPDDITTYFTLLLAKGEAAWLYDLFTGPDGEAVQLKDRFKPLWYAVLKQLDHPDFLRMGEELAQTVEEILAKAREMAVAYS